MTVPMEAVASIAADAGTLWQSLIAVAPLVDVGFDRPRQAAVTLVTFAVTAVVVAGAAALTYRWYFRDEIPENVTGLLGVAVVALYLNTTSLGAVAVGESPALLGPQRVSFNVVSLGVAAVTAPAGRYVGDRLAVDVFALSEARQLEGELSGIVRAVGRFTAVALPPAEGIGDTDTYDPVSPKKKAEMAGKTLLFARKLSGEELRERLVARVKGDHGVGYVDVDVTEDGEVGYFAVGSRAAGLGPTLAPGSAAVAVAADPPNNATVGDVDVVVAAVRPEDGSVQPIPPRAYAFDPGDLVYLVGRPDALRRFEADAAGKRVEPLVADASAGVDGDSPAGSGGGSRVDAETESGEGTQRS